MFYDLLTSRENSWFKKRCRTHLVRQTHTSTPFPGMHPISIAESGLRRNSSFIRVINNDNLTYTIGDAFLPSTSGEAFLPSTIGNAVQSRQKYAGDAADLACTLCPWDQVRPILTQT